MKKTPRRALVDPEVIFDAISGRSLGLLPPLHLGAGACLRSGTVLYRGSTIGKHFETGHHVIIREQNKIGDHVSIWNNSTIDYGCRIGNRVKIHCNAYVAQYSILEDDVFLAPGAILANDRIPGSRFSPQMLQGPIIRKGAQIGINTTILPGVVIGAGAIVGAGSVVTKSVPVGAVVWGNPARPRKRRSDLYWPSGQQAFR
jgi:acetyltransferase-like isoleucine patch superfamily enzyme